MSSHCDWLLFSSPADVMCRHVFRAYLREPIDEGASYSEDERGNLTVEIGGDQLREVGHAILKLPYITSKISEKRKKAPTQGFC